MGFDTVPPGSAATAPAQPAPPVPPQPAVPDAWTWLPPASARRWAVLGAVLPARDLVAIPLAGAGALLVFVSLLVDWQVIRFAGVPPVRAGIADIPTWGTVYVLGAMSLIALFVGVVALPVQLGRPARVLGIAWSLGVAAIITAMLVRLTDTPAVESGELLRDILNGSSAGAVTVAWRSGIVYAAMAVVLLMGAFIAACPPLRDISATGAGADR